MIIRDAPDMIIRDAPDHDLKKPIPSFLSVTRKSFGFHDGDLNYFQSSSFKFAYPLCLLNCDALDRIILTCQYS